jgi:hypothetical protein
MARDFPPTPLWASPCSKPCEPLPTGDAVRVLVGPAALKAKGGCCRSSVDAYPGAVERDAASEAAGYRKSTRDLYPATARRAATPPQSSSWKDRGAVWTAEALFG